MGWILDVPLPWLLVFPEFSFVMVLVKVVVFNHFFILTEPAFNFSYSTIYFVSPSHFATKALDSAYQLNTATAFIFLWEGWI